MFFLRRDSERLTYPTGRSVKYTQLESYVSFVRIHPFFDGNGRIARLLANLPVLYAGFPPIVVPSEARLDYIRELWAYQRAVGVISLANRELVPEPSRLDNLRRLAGEWWRTTLDLVAEAKGKRA